VSDLYFETNLKPDLSNIGDYKKVFMLIHGYGADELDLIDLANYLSSNLYSGNALEIPYISLRARIPLPFGGYAWANVESNQDMLDRAVNNKPFADYVNSPELIQEYQESSKAVQEFVLNKIPDSTKIIPLGFSQGGTLASELLRNLPQKLDRTIICSGWVEPKPYPNDQNLKDQKVFFGYGTADELLAEKFFTDATKFFEKYTDAEIHAYNDMTHTIREDELIDIKNFINN